MRFAAKLADALTNLNPGAGHPTGDLAEDQTTTDFSKQMRADTPTAQQRAHFYRRHGDSSVNLGDEPEPDSTPNRAGKTTTKWPHKSSSLGLGGFGVKSTGIMPAPDDEPTAVHPTAIPASSIARGLLMVLNPFERGSFAGTADWIAPEQISSAKPFDEDMVEYFHTIMSIHAPKVAALWHPAVYKYKRFEQECERVVVSEGVEPQGQPHTALAKKLDMLSFKKIIAGIARIKNVLDNAGSHGLERMRAAFDDFAGYVAKVAPTVQRFLSGIEP